MREPNASLAGGGISALRVERDSKTPSLVLLLLLILGFLRIGI